MFNFTPHQRVALIFFSCLLAVLLLTAGYLRLARSGRFLHALFIQPMPMQTPTAEASQIQPPILAQPLVSPRPPAVVRPPLSTPRSTTVNINAASVSELQVLPGVGPGLASQIVRHREVHGPFHSVDDLLKVEGVGPKTLERIRPFIALGQT